MCDKDTPFRWVFVSFLKISSNFVRILTIKTELYEKDEGNGTLCRIGGKPVVLFLYRLF